MFIPVLVTLLSSVVFLDELTPAYPDDRHPDGRARWRSDTAIGWPTGVHLIGEVGDESPAVVSLIDEEGLPIPVFHVGRLHPVPVEENTGLDSRTEQYSGKRNPYVIRRAPFEIYEAIEPVPLTGATAHISGGARLALRLEITPEQAGRRNLIVRVTRGDQTVELPWSVMTYDWTPGVDRAFSYTNWFSPTEMAERHQVPRWSEDHWQVLEAYARLMARGGQDTFWVRWPDFFRKGDGGWTLNQDRLHRYITIFLTAGFERIEGAPLARRPDGDWSAPTLELQLGQVPVNSPEGRAVVGRLIDQFGEVLRKSGWWDRWIQHLADEPTDTNAADYRAFAEFFRARAPGVPIIEATMTRALVDAVDIWCPQVHEYQAQIDFFTDRRSAGDEVWTYTCLVPGGPWLNRLLDQERLRSVYFGWAGARFPIDGFLHWGLNHYKADPFAVSVVDHPAMPQTTNKLPAGDTHVIYPGPAGPWSSTRFEAQRIGLEDLTALRCLTTRQPDLAAEIVNRVFRGYDDWESSVARYRDARGALLQAVAGESP